MNRKDNEQWFKELWGDVEREGKDNVLRWLEESGFFEAPASTKYHLSEPGGLLQHSLNVYCNMQKLNRREFDKETLIICALLHDICKLDCYKKTETGYEWNKDQWPMGHGEKSVVILLSLGLGLSDEEMLAIRWHSGAFDPAYKGGDRNAEVWSKHRLSAMLHIADLKATWLDETLP